jgi:phosphoglycolate phosphatase
MKYKCIIFDCDGTLIDTLEDIAVAMNQTLELHGFPPMPSASYRDMVGWGLDRLASLVLPAEARTSENIRAISSCAQQLMTGQEHSAQPYPGMRELVAELSSLRQAKKITTAVLSNKPDPVLRLLMDDFFGQNTFDAVCGLRPGLAPKPDPQSVWEILAELGCSPSDAIFVGDSEVDMETARNAGCFPLGVSWGFRSRAALEKSGAARIIDTPEEIWELLK